MFLHFLFLVVVVRRAIKRPVSYTHLDVYKRQAQDALRHEQADDGDAQRRQEHQLHADAHDLADEMCIRDSAKGGFYAELYQSQFADVNDEAV